MSLQVWLPLNGDLKNQGLSDVVLNNSGITYTDGKIGQAANFSSSCIGITNTPITGSIDNFSFCFWLKTSSPSSTMCLYNGRTDTGGPCSIFIINGNLRFDDGTQHSLAYSIPTNTWEHYTITRNSSNIKLYVNGELIDTTTATAFICNATKATIGVSSVNTSTGNGNNYLVGQLNDYRIYDHCLSPKEVKEISKGLCLHYRLSGPGQENLFTHTSPDEKKSSDEWMQIGNDTTSIFDQYGLVPYTVSFEAKSEIAGDFMLYSTSGSNPKYSWTKTTINLTTDWQYFTYTFTPTLNASDGTWSRISIYGTYDTGKIPSIRNAKLELGNIATPWIPNSSDSDYFKMRYDNNIEYDCSGYCRNGTKSGTITWDADSPRYTTSYQLTTANIVGPIPNRLKPAESITIAMWVRLASERTSGELALFNNYEGGGAGLDINGTSYGMQIYSGEYKGAWVDMAGKMTQWHHFAGTFDGNNIKTYIDGELKATVAVTAGSTISYHPDTPWSIGINPGPSGGSGGMNGNISDARIYATALSAEDILQLYNSPINIDNGNNLYAYEFIEEEENNFSKQGIVKNSEFIDLDTAGDSYTNASISSTVDCANIFIEK